MLLVHILRNGVVLFPPFPEPKIPTLLHAQSVLPTDYFWHEGMTGWAIVSERWTPAADSAPVAPLLPEAPVEAPAPAAPRDPSPIASPRRNRPSLLDEAKRRYHETLAPWTNSAVPSKA
jgi:hypothetical protein